MTLLISLHAFYTETEFYQLVFYASTVILTIQDALSLRPLFVLVLVRAYNAQHNEKSVHSFTTFSPVQLYSLRCYNLTTVCNFQIQYFFLVFHIKINFLRNITLLQWHNFLFSKVDCFGYNFDFIWSIFYKVCFLITLKNCAEQQKFPICLESVIFFEPNRLMFIK